MTYSLDDLVKFLEAIAPVVIPSLLLYLFDRRRRKSESRKIDSESDANLVQAAEKLVNTGGTLVTQLERQLTALDTDYKKAIASLEKTNNQYMLVMEQFDTLSQQHRELRGSATRMINELAEKDAHIKRLEKCVKWLLYYLRPIAPAGLNLPKPWDVELWIGRAETLNGVEFAQSEKENADAEATAGAALPE